MIDINNILKLIIEAQVFILAIIVISYIVERVTPFKLFIDHFFWEKSLNNAKSAAGFHRTLYFIINLVYFVYSIKNNEVEYNFYNVGIWLVITILLSIAFRDFYSNYQKVDKTKADNDFT